MVALRDTFKVTYVAPGHCTGEAAFAALRKAFGDRYLYAGLGTSLAIAATPRPIAAAGAQTPARMDGDDLDSYRSLLATSDDDTHPLLAGRHE